MGIDLNGEDINKVLKLQKLAEMAGLILTTSERPKPICLYLELDNEDIYLELDNEDIYPAGICGHFSANESKFEFDTFNEAWWWLQGWMTRHDFDQSVKEWRMAHEP